MKTDYFFLSIDKSNLTKTIINRYKSFENETKQRQLNKIESVKHEVMKINEI